MEIPETVWAEAKRWSSFSMEKGAGLTTGIVARAIMAERDRCAEIANKWAVAEQDNEQVGSEEWLVRVSVNSCAQNIKDSILGKS